MTPPRRSQTPGLAGHGLATEGSEELIAAPTSGRRGYVLIVPWDLRYPGGVNQVVLNLVREIESDGRFVPIVLMSKWRGRVAKPNDVIESIELRQPIYPHKPIRSLLGYFFKMPWWLPRLLQTMRSLDPAVINFHYPTLAAWPLLTIRALGLMRFTVVLSFHGTDVENARKEPWYVAWLWRAMIDRSDHVVACSENLATQLRALAPSMKKDAIVINNGITLPTHSNDAQLAPIERPTDRFVLSVGTYVHKKGMDVVLQAFALIAPKFPDVSLVLIGRTGAEYPALVKLVAALDLAQSVSLLADLDHETVMRYQRAATVFVLASRDESFGIALLEAGASGVPVVASRVGGVPEILSSPDLGVLVEPDNAEVLAIALEGLLAASDAMRRRMGERLKEHVLANFTWKAAGREYLRLAEAE